MNCRPHFHLLDRTPGHRVLKQSIWDAEIRKIQTSERILLDSVWHQWCIPHLSGQKKSKIASRIWTVEKKNRPCHVFPPKSFSWLVTEQRGDPRDPCLASSSVRWDHPEVAGKQAKFHCFHPEVIEIGYKVPCKLWTMSVCIYIYIYNITDMSLYIYTYGLSHDSMMGDSLVTTTSLPFQVSAANPWRPQLVGSDTSRTVAP